jgi:N-acetyl-anhydromuramyl-L-alanine amidase AmpD
MFQIIERLSPHGGGTQRPKGIIVHAMGYQVDYNGARVYAASLLEQLGLSAHILVAPDGTRIRCRKDTEVAWQAKGYNTGYLGIEVLCPEAYDLAMLKRRTAEPGWVAPQQMLSVIEQVKEWVADWDINRDMVRRHSDIDPIRRSFDPGAGFPWERLLHEVYGD